MLHFKSLSTALVIHFSSVSLPFNSFPNKIQGMLCSFFNLPFLQIRMLLKSSYIIIEHFEILLILI